MERQLISERDAVSAPDRNMITRARPSLRDVDHRRRV